MFGMICTLLPKGPAFKHATITLQDAPNEHHDLYYCDIMECAQFLFSNPNYKEHMDYAPEELFEEDANGKPTQNRIYAEMSLGKIWNEEQVRFQVELFVWNEGFLISGL